MAPPFTLCTVCARAGGEHAVPDRSDHDAPYRYDVMCPTCLDAFLSLFPLRPAALLAYQLGGALPPLNPPRFRAPAAGVSRRGATSSRAT